MAKIETTLPTVQFGNVKVTFSPEELGLSDISDSHALGVAAAVYLSLFTQGFKVGASMEVVPGLQEVSQKATSAPVGGVQGLDEVRALALLDEGLGGVTEVPEDEYDSASEAKAATQERTAPWTEPAVDAKPKPWETENLPPEAVVTSPAVLDAIW